MAGGKGKSSGGKSSGGKTSGVDGPKKQQSHSQRAGLQVCFIADAYSFLSTGAFLGVCFLAHHDFINDCPPRRRARTQFRNILAVHHQGLHAPSGVAPPSSPYISGRAPIPACLAGTEPCSLPSEGPALDPTVSRPTRLSALSLCCC